MDPRSAYTLFMLLALAVFLLARHFVPKPPALVKLPWNQRLGLTLAAFVGGTFAAKLPFVAQSDAGWLSPHAWFSDGKTVTLGLVGAYLGVELMKLASGIRVKTGDTFALPLALALAVGRWGCFFNGCCYGTPTDLPWGVPFVVAGKVAVCHPTQIYESLFHLAMAGVLLMLVRLRLLPHQHLKLYLIAYGLFRFLTEFIRPEPRDYLGLTLYQLVMLGMIAGLAVQWWWDARRQRDEVLSPALAASPQSAH
jgi:prolipoprotein diacylglyceryltransferase